MQALLELVCKWAGQARLELNVSKCAAMYVSYARAKALKRTLLPLFINGLRISMVTEMKILGILFTSSFDWLKQETLVRAKISRMSSVLQRFGCTLDTLTRQSIQRIYSAAKISRMSFDWLKQEMFYSVYWSGVIDQMITVACLTILYSVVLNLSCITQKPY